MHCAPHRINTEMGTSYSDTMESKLIRTMRTTVTLLLAVLSLLTLTACSSGKRSVDIGGLYPIISKERDRKWGYIDKSGNVVIQPQFKEAHFFSDGLACVTPDGKKYGYIDKTGKFVVNPQYDAALPFSEGLAAVVIDKKTGFIDTTGKVVIPPQFDPVQRRGDLWFYSYSEGLAAVSLGQKCGYVDKSGKFVVNPQYKECMQFYERLAPVRVEDQWGYIDPTGKIVINPQFEKAFPFTEGLALVKMGKKWGYIDKTGKYVINPQFDQATPFSSEGLAGVLVGNKWGSIDKTGKMVINPQFDGNYLTTPDGEIFAEILVRDIGRVTFSDGLAAVRVGEKSGYIDKSGNYVINPQFDLALPFVGGLALVAVGHGPGDPGSYIGWIDKKGTFVWKMTP